MIAIVSLVIGLAIIFNVVLIFPGDPVASYLDSMGMDSSNQQLYTRTANELGIDNFAKFFVDFFTGNWWVSVSVRRGVPVTDLIGEGISLMIVAIILPIIIGVIVGFLLGWISSKNRGTWKDQSIQLFSILGLSLPVFFISMIFQYTLCHELSLCEPTGISLLSGFILVLAFSALITWHVRSYFLNKSCEKSVMSNTIITGIIFSFSIMCYALLDVSFIIGGFGSLLVEAFLQYDFFLTRGCLFGIIIIFVILTVISNLIFSFYRFLKSESLENNLDLGSDDELNKERNNSEDIPDERIKDYLKNRLKSPLGILGVILVIFFIFISIFPQVITQYSFEETIATYPGAWNAPSSEHPLGQTADGMDVLALIIWGIRDSLIIGLGAVLIGLIGGTISGLIAGKFNRWGYKIIMGLMIFFYIFPGFILVIFSTSNYGPLSWRFFGFSIFFIFGMILIPNFTRAIANAISGEISINKIGKAVISQIPLNIAIAIIIYITIGFLGFADPTTTQLGFIVYTGGLSLSNAPWAGLWPGITIFGLVLSFFILHLGLKDFEIQNGLL